MDSPIGMASTLPLKCADEVSWLEDEEEGHEVAEEDAREEDVGELPTGCLHDGSGVVTEEDGRHEEGH